MIQRYSGIGLTLLVLLNIVVFPFLAGPVTGQSNGDLSGNFPNEERMNKSHWQPHSKIGEKDQTGDLSTIETWLKRDLQTRLNRSLVSISNGDYNRSRNPLGSEYTYRLNQLETILVERGKSTESAELFAQARKLQLQFINQHRRFYRNYEAYREAKHEGNTESIAHFEQILRQDENAINQTSSNLVDTYRSMTPSSGYFWNQIQTVSPLSREISYITSNIPENNSPTTLTIDINGSEASFTDPLLVEGQLQSLNNTPVVGETVVFRVANRRYETRTDWRGRFSLKFRPVEVQPGIQDITIRYLPTYNQGYLPSSATFTTNISSSSPEMKLEVTPENVSYQGNVTISGEVNVPLRPWVFDHLGGVESVPVEIRMGNKVVGQVETGPEGHFSLNTSLGNDTRPGNLSVEAHTVNQNWAITTVTETVSVNILVSDTSLSVVATPLGPNEFIIEGQLLTNSGNSVSKAPVLFKNNGKIIKRVQTNKRGRFETTINGVDLQEGATLSVEYNRHSKLLRPTKKNINVIYRPGPNQDSFIWFEIPGTNADIFKTIQQKSDPGLIGGGLLIGTLGLAVFIFYVHRGWQENILDGAEEPELHSIARSTTSQNIDPERLINYANGQLTSGNTNLAVIAAYAAIRQRENLGPSDRKFRTQWEFYNACETDGFSDDELESLEYVTRQSEKAAFEQNNVSHEAASKSIDIADTLGA